MVACEKKVIASAIAVFCLLFNLINGQYGCSYSFQVNSNDFGHPGSSSSFINPYCKDSCLQSSPAFIDASANPDCVLLHRVLPDYNSVIDDGDCLELQFMPGEYWFSSLSQIQLSYSLVLTAPWGRVSIACSQTEGTECDNKGHIMMSFNGSQKRQNTSVIMESLSFSNCSKRLQFNYIYNVTIINSTFQGFTSSALDMFDVDHVTLKDSQFIECRVEDGNAQYRANGGAVSVAYDYKGVKATKYPTLDVIGCTFYNNSALIVDSDQLNQALANFTYSGRGGGLSLIIQGTHANVHTHVRDSDFIGNSAQAYGGGFYVLIAGEATYHNFNLDNCSFVGNFGGVDGFGGGVIYSLLLRNQKSRFPVRIILDDCYFENNQASNGAGLAVIEVYSQGKGNELAVFNTHFVNNQASAGGAAIMLQTFSYVQRRRERLFYNFTDCEFHGNEALGGTFGVGFSSVNFFGNILFSRNTGPSLRLVGSLLELHGNLSFVENTVPANVEGGALFIQAFGQVKLKRGASLNFIRNKGVSGAAIVVDVQRSSPVFSQLIFNPQCFLIYEDLVQPDKWINVKVRFFGNKADVGPAVLASHLHHCSWQKSIRVNATNSNEVITSFSVKFFPKWPVFDYDRTNIASTHKTDTHNECFFFQTQTFQVVSSLNFDNLRIRPGEVTTIDIYGLDQFGNPSSFIARVSDGRFIINSGAFGQASTQEDADELSMTRIEFDPARLPVDPALGRANLTFGYSATDNLTQLATMKDTPVPVAIDVPFNFLNPNTLTFNMTLSPCQLGHQLTLANGIYTCRCADNGKFALTCDDDEVVFRDGIWMGPRLITSDPHLDVTLCPTTYCRCRMRGVSQRVCDTVYFLGDGINDQCHPTRQGILCGECVNGTTVGVLRTNCRKCHSDKYYTIALLVVADMVVLGFVFFTFMKLDFHFPHSLKGLLFYIQTAYYATESFPASFWDVRKYMLYSSSALSLYFPYDFCLSPGTDALTTFGLKFIPPAIAFILCLAVAIGVYADRSRIGRAGRRHVWRVLWFLLLLFYAPLLHTCTALLKCPVTPSASGREEARRWYFNGEVECFHDPVHIVLSIVAILVLTALVLLIPAMAIFIMTTNRMEKDKFRYRTVEWIVAALGEGYRDCLEARLYAVWELMRRLLLVSIVVAAPGRSVASAYVVIASFGVHILFNPYHMIFQNVLEMLVLLNYIIFLLVRSNDTILDAVNYGRYSGNQVPDTVGASLPPMDHVAWLFILPFYLPLVFAVVFSIGALVYRVGKSFIQWRKRKKREEESSTISQSYLYVSHRSRIVPITMVEGPS